VTKYLAAPPDYEQKRRKELQLDVKPIGFEEPFPYLGNHVLVGGIIGLSYFPVQYSFQQHGHKFVVSCLQGSGGAV
jgi:hypothetical protein